MVKKKSLGLNAVLNGIRILTNMLFPLITFRYVTMVLPVENIGIYNFALSFINYFILIAGMGIPIYSVREGAKYRDRKDIFNRFASEIFSINMATTAIAYLLLFLCVCFIPSLAIYATVISIFSIELFFMAVGAEWIYVIYEEYGYITVRSIIIKLISVVIIVVLVQKPQDHLVYAYITVSANVFANIINYLKLRQFCKLHLTYRFSWKKHLKPIMIIFMSSAAVSIYVNSDMTMLGLMASEYYVGLYTVAAKIYRMMKQLLSAILIVSIPRLSMLMGQKRRTEYEETFNKIFNAIILLLFPAVVGLYMLSEEVIMLISNSSYLAAADSLRILSVALIFCIIAWLFSQCVLIPAKKEKIVLGATTTSALVNVLLNYFLIPKWDMEAVAITTLVAELIMMLICCYSGLKIVSLGGVVKNNLITTAIGSAGVVLVCVLIGKLGFDSLWTMIYSTLGSVVVYGAILLLSRNKFVYSLLKFKDKD